MQSEVFREEPGIGEEGVGVHNEPILTMHMGRPRALNTTVKVRPTSWPGFTDCLSALMHTRMGPRLLARAP